MAEFILLAAVAPFNDLQYFHWMENYKIREVDAAEANIKSIQRHLDYLAEELVVFSLFDPDLPESEKSLVGRKLFGAIRPDTFPPGNPRLPVVIWPKEGFPSLSSFVGPRSWLLFDLLKLDGKNEWLKCPVEMWPNFEAYVTAKKIR